MRKQLNEKWLYQFMLNNPVHSNERFKRGEATFSACLATLLIARFLS